MEIPEERLYLVLGRLLESLQPPPVKAIGDIKPKGTLSPTVLATAIVPAVGGTIVDYPTIATYPSAPTPPASSSTRFGASGFTVTIEGDKVKVSEGKIWWGGEEKTVPPTELPLPSYTGRWLVVVDLLTGKVRITTSVGATEEPLYDSAAGK